MELAFIPIYIKFIGIESYGLFGFYLTIKALLSIFDLGLGLVVNHELARLSIKSDNEIQMRNILRTFEYIYLGIGFFLGLILLLSSSIIANYWFLKSTLSQSVIINSIKIMGLIIFMQWPQSLYTNALLGLQKQLLLNINLIITSTFKSLGALIFLNYFNKTISNFLLWQFISMALISFYFCIVTWYSMPKNFKGSQKFDLNVIKDNSNFAIGVFFLSFLVAIITQIDKIFLSKFLTLEDFGYYTLASTIGYGINFIVYPFNITLFPKFTQFITERKNTELKILYHKSSYFLSNIIFPITFIFIFYTQEILSIWIHDTLTITKITNLVRFIIIGTLLNSLVTIPYCLQLANKWTKLSLYKNIITLFLITPLIFILVKHYGAIGATYVWIILNIGYILIEIPFMHKKILINEKYNWYLYDIVLPLSITFIIFLTSTAIDISDFAYLVKYIYLFVLFTFTFLIIFYLKKVPYFKFFKNNFHDTLPTM